MKVLIVVDMQNDFIDGVLGTREAVAIVPHVKKKIEAYRAEKKTVIFTRDTHGEDYLLTQEGRKLPVEHCIRGSHGWKISSKLDTADSEIIDKPTFGSYDLIERLEELDQEDALEICGAGRALHGHLCDLKRDAGEEPVPGASGHGGR